MFETSYINFVNIINTASTLLRESYPEIDFDIVQEDSGETSRPSYIDYFQYSFTDLFSFHDITADKDSSNSNNESDHESYKSENEEVPLKKVDIEKYKVVNIKT